MRRFLPLLIASVCVCAGPLKPVSVQADVKMDQAVWIAEAVVTEVSPGAFAEGEKKDRGRVRVKVTTDPERVFKGFQMLGREVDLLPPTWGPAECTADMAVSAKAGTALLFVVDKDGGFAMVGQAMEKADEPTYHLRSWCDYNAWWIFSNDKNFGKSVGKDMMSTIEVTIAAVTQRYRAEGAGFAAKQISFLVGVEPLMTGVELSRRLEELGSDDVDVREAATADLTKRGAWNIEALRAASTSTEDSEVKARIGTVLAGFVEYSAAYDAAMAARRRGVDDEVKFLVAGHPFVDETLKGKILDRLRALGADAAADRLRPAAPTP